LVYSTNPSNGLETGMSAGASSAQMSAMVPRICPCGVCAQKLLAALLEPVVQSIQRWKARRGLPQTMTRVLNVLLYLPLLPA
jgi:hypothetical protein